jgi:hypothetical protein
MNLMRVCIVAAVASLAVIAATALAVHADQDSKTPAGVTTHRTGQDASSATSYWTKERMRNAKPRPWPFPTAPGPSSVNPPRDEPQDPTPARPPK